MNNPSNGMLVLSRKAEQKLMITLPSGEEIMVMIVEIRGDKVRLGVKCARDIVVDREEVYLDKKANPC